MERPTALQPGVTVKRIRIIIDHWDETLLYGHCDAYGELPLKVHYRETDIFADLPTLLYPQCQLNLLTVLVREDGNLQPELLVFEPDYLIDISSLAECLQNYGDSPLNYLVNKFKPRENSHHILLGNAANQFLDDCVNEQPGQPASYERSMQKVFRSELLAYSANEHIDKEYFDRAQHQFKAIHDTVQAVFNSPTCQIDKSGALLEPSFLCECMGLQGRMDFLQGDFKSLIELKSGKADGAGISLHPRESHALQMALYKEVLYYSLDIPRNAITSYLFYSQYPKLFVGHSNTTQIQQAMQLRNRIVANERTLATDGGQSLLPQLTADSLNTRHVHGRLWEVYQRLQLEAFLQPIREAGTLTADYFHRFTAFVAREQFLSKTGGGAGAADYGFSSIWNADTATKMEMGNMLINLKITDFTSDEGIDKVILEIPSADEHFLPNFRQGDIVLLYERNDETDKATNRQVIRGNIETLTAHSLTIGLRYHQRNPIVFHRESRYAIEHDFMDSSYSTLYKGLYTLLTTPRHRRDLLLCQRNPERNKKVSLSRHYLNEEIDHIVLQAKQAHDYFLLVGPPGTGKTSVALRSMVEEFHSQPDCNLLLLSYTNRAVDEICEMLESISPAPPYLRIGSELSCEPRFRPHLLKNFMQHCARRSEVCRAVSEVRIICGTVASIGGKPELFQLKHFDVAIVDEASQILEPQIIGLLCAHNKGRCAIGKFILIGDHKQLPAVVLQQPEESEVRQPALLDIGLTNCRNSLFERLSERQRLQPAEGIQAMLHRQGRMHPAISDFVNQHFYACKLGIIPLPHQETDLEWKTYAATDTDERLAATSRLCFIDTPLPPEDEPDKVNRHEACMAARLVSAIHRLCEKNGEKFDAARRIGIIVPFRNQIALIAHRLAELKLPNTEEITIDTVERYQGSQRDIIIYSTTVSKPYLLDILSAPVDTDGITIDRKLNVALTRARKQLFIIGHAPLLEQQPVYQKLLDFIRQKGLFCSSSRTFLAQK